MQMSGSTRNFYYHTPRPGLTVSSGTLLFNGTRIGFQYVGTAYVFSAQCPAVGYRVTGGLSSDLHFIRLTGRAPVRRPGSCQVDSYRDDILEFQTLDDDTCGCECPGEIPVASYDRFIELSQSGAEASCPYLYSWNDEKKIWKSHGKIIHVAEGRNREAIERIVLTELTSKFRLSEHEPENSYIDQVELRIEMKNGSLFVLKPNTDELAHRDGNYLFLPAYTSVEFEFDLPPWLLRTDIESTSLWVTGYYERIASQPGKAAGPQICRPAAVFSNKNN